MEGKGKALFWGVAIVALIWNAMGCINFVQQLSPAGRATLPADYQVLIENRALWATAAFALSVIAGLVGAILMLMRRSQAVMAFALSLAGAVISMAPAFQNASSSVIIGTFMTVVLTALFLWVARRFLS